MNKMNAQNHSSVKDFISSLDEQTARRLVFIQEKAR